MISKQSLQAYFELTKPRVTLLVLITTAVGFYMGSPASLSWIRLALVLIGTALVAGGTSALNQYLELDIDARMRRTRNRPLPSKRLAPAHALVFGTVVSLAGVISLGVWLNWLTALLALITLVTYVFLYTPLKQKSTISTLVGAVPGALPPVGGWTAARGELTLEAWLLFAILFFWQLPHFLAIAWVYREDYARGGIKVLPLSEDHGDATIRQILLNCFLLLLISLMPTILGVTGNIYLLAALLLGLFFLASGIQMSLRRTNRYAKRLLFASIIYLPLLLMFMVLNKAPIP